MAYAYGINWSKHKQRLIELVSRGLIHAQIADILSRELKREVSIASVQVACGRYRILKSLIPIDDGIKFYQEKTIPEDNYMVSCDYHSPYHSEEWINRLLLIADKFKIKKSIIVGDLFDMDFAKKFYDDEHTTLDIEITHASPVIKALDYFEMNYLVRGNHEKRVNISTDSRIQARHLFGLFGKDVWEKKFRFTPYDKISIGKKWLLVHPRSYSQIGGAVAIRLAEKFHRHVLNAHGHFIALRYDRSGKYMGVDLGGCFDIRKIKYISETTTSHPFWNQGFGMIYNGHFHHFHNGTDWGYWLNGK